MTTPLMQRKYSLDEIDRMRDALRKALRYQQTTAYREGELFDHAESQLRTCMMNGTDPEELEAYRDKACEAMVKRNRDRFERRTNEQT
jgi:hypothetical protein